MHGVHDAYRPQAPRRRWFLKSALALTALAGVVGGGVWWRRGLEDGHLTAEGRGVFRALARGVLGPLLPQGDGREAALDGHLEALERFVRTLPRLKQQQLSLLAGALAHAPTRWLAAGRWATWETASDDDVARALARIASTGHPVQQLVFVAFRGLTCLVYFSTPSHGAPLGYPGPVPT